MDRRITKPGALTGTVIAPGDKSLSHRAVIFNAIAEGTAVIEHFLAGDDCLATIDILRALGVEIEVELTDGQSATVTVHGVGLRGLREPADVLDARNSGTTMRLLSGLLAGQPFYSVITGDASLRSRPMGRVIEPLRLMGAQICGRSQDRLAPLTIRGGGLRGIDYATPVASAQVKSAIILAALYADGETRIVEPAASRDHTERMLAAMGAGIFTNGNEVRVETPGNSLRPTSTSIPADLSGAAFWLVAASLHPDAEVRLPGVGTNPTRMGIIDVLRAMGADIRLENERTDGGEPVADIFVRSAPLHGTTIAGDLVPRVIDELPVLALAAALAEGETIITDAAELRVKESDRITTTVTELRKFGAEIEERPDGMIIQGVRQLRGANCRSYGDHRLAMTLAVAGLLSTGTTVLSGSDAVDVSYPEFWTDLDRLSSIPVRN